MLKKLTAKVQQLNPNLPENIGAFSRCLMLEPDSSDLILKKGAIYAVFDVSSNTGFDISLITNVVHDVLYNSYYQSDNVSPIQSLEKAITQVKDKVMQMTNESIISEQPGTTFKMVAGVLWGNVMYVVQYGDAKSYLMRKGEIRPVSTMGEGSFSSASGVVKDDDVIILCSSGFAEGYPPDKLLSVSIPENQLKPQEAGMLVKFLIDTTFTQNEVVDFGMEVPVHLPSETNPAAKLINGLKTRFSVKPLYSQKKPAVKLPSTDTIIPSKPKIRLPFTGGIKLKTPSNVKLKPVYFVPVIALAFITSIFFTVKNKNNGRPVSENQNNIATESQTGNTGSPDQAAGLTISPEPEQPKEPEAQIFYDLTLSDPSVNPAQIAVFENYVVVSEKDSGKIYVSGTETPKFNTETNSFPGISNLTNIKGDLGFTDNEGYKVYSLSKSEITENYTSEELGVTATYSDYIYSIKDDTLTRYTKSGGALSGITWGQNAVFKNVNSFSISYSIYFLLNSGEVKKFTSGEENGFSLTGDAKTITEAVQLITDIDFDNIYIADKGNQRAVVFNKDGEFIKEYLPKTEGRWSDIKSIGISPDEKMLYVLSGTRVYEVEL